LTKQNRFQNVTDQEKAPAQTSNAEAVANQKRQEQAQTGGEEPTNKLWIIAAVLIAIIGGAFAAYAATNWSTTTTHTGTIKGDPSFQVYWNGTNCTNGEPYNWETLTLGTNKINLTVINISNNDLIVSITSQGLPSGATYIWGDSTIAIIHPDVPYSANYTLTLPSTLTVETTITWNTTISTRT